MSSSEAKMPDIVPESTEGVEKAEIPTEEKAKLNTVDATRKELLKPLMGKTGGKTKVGAVNVTPKSTAPGVATKSEPKPRTRNANSGSSVKVPMTKSDSKLPTASGRIRPKPNTYFTKTQYTSAGISGQKPRPPVSKTETPATKRDSKPSNAEAVVGELKPTESHEKADPKKLNFPDQEPAGISNKPKKSRTPDKRRKSKLIPFELDRKKLDKGDEKTLVDGLGKLSLTDTTPVTEFEDMGLKSDVLKAIYAYGLEKPAFCQQHVIVPLVEGRDLICQAQSGMGKTAAFCIAILQRIDLSNESCQALVLAPTRELAMQISDVFLTMGKSMGIKTVPCIGQDGHYRQNQREVGGAHIAVGTVGRICHLFHDRALIREKIRIFVIDEADKMILDRSFYMDLKYLIGAIPGDAQVIVMSATMPSSAMEKMRYFMRRPLEFLVKNDQLTLDGIQQFHVNVGAEEHKLNTLMELFPFLNRSRGITFCSSRYRASYVSKQMEVRGHVIAGMVGSMDQSDRYNTLQKFRTGELKSLVASDLLGRGVDIQHVKLVVNYDLPEKMEEYIHRIGRAGRYGRKGIAITFITDPEQEKLKLLEEFYHTRIPPMPDNIADLMEMTESS